MKVISKSTNANNSRVTVEFKGTSGLQAARFIANRYGCGLSNNVTCSPVIVDGEVKFLKSFGTVSFNKGNHEAALAEFLKA